MIFRHIILAVLLTLLCAGSVKGQEERADLQALVHTEIGPEFAIATMLDMDASLRNSGRVGEGALESIYDPYGTLTGTIIFSVYAERLPDDSNMGTLGVYREGRILWTAPPDTFEYCERPTEVMAVRDLDHNELVDRIRVAGLLSGQLTMDLQLGWADRDGDARDRSVRQLYHRRVQGLLRSGRCRWRRHN